MTFRPHEIEFLHGTTLGRLATIQPNGTLQNSPVGFSYNETLGTIDIFGFHMSKSQKYRNIASNPTVAFVVDDIFSVDPWRVRCLEIRGTAEAIEKPSDSAYGGSDPIIRVRARRIISYGTEEQGAIPGQVRPHNRNVA